MAATDGQRRLGLIAGQGRFPLELAESIRQRDFHLVGVGLRGFTAPGFEALVHEMHWLYLGELGALIELLKGAGLCDLIMAGKVPKTDLYGDPASLHLDARVLAALATLKDRKDDSIMSMLADVLEGEGLHVRSQVEFVPDLLAGEGPLGAVHPTSNQFRDVAFGWPIAKAIGGMDIGQTIVVGNLAVLAIEAIEGTDAAIRRGGSLGKGCACVVKVSKPDQDLRFDVPAIGPETIEVLAEAQAGVLAVEAGKTLVLCQEETIRAADAAGIAVVGVSAESLGLGEGCP